MHIGEKQFHHKISGATFCQNTHLKAHILTHCREKAFHNEICRATFFENSSLKRLMSTGEKKFHCEICGTAFLNNSCLKRHIRMAFWEECLPSMELHFPRIHISKHRLTNTEEKPFHYEIFGTIFSLSTHFKVHIFTHAQEKLFQW